jgi:hypothetical protein
METLGGTLLLLPQSRDSIVIRYESREGNVVKQREVRKKSEGKREERK